MNMDQNELKTIPTVSASVTENSQVKSGSACDTVKVSVKHRNAIINLLRDYDIAIFNIVYIFGLAIVSNAEQDLMLAKVCQNAMGLTEEQCTNRSTNGSHNHDEVYQRSNTYLMYIHLISTGPAVVMLLFLGPWSDKYGYKLPMIWATTGVFMNSFGLMVNSIFFQLPPIYVVLSSIPLGLSGGDIAVFSITSAYVGNKTKANNRVFVLLLIELCASVSELVGTYATGVIFRKHGYTAVFLTSTCFYGASALWQAVIVSEQPSHQADSCTKAKDFFSLQEMKEMCRTCIKKRSGWLRLEIWALLLSIFLQNVAGFGTGQVLYYSTQKMYGWDLPKFTEVKTVVNAVNTVVLPCIMAAIKRWKVDDVPLGIFILTCLTARYVTLLFAYTEWLFYLSCAFGAFASSSMAVLHALLMRCVDENEYGKLFALRAALNSAAPLVASPVATAIFNHTISYFIGAVFLYCACCQSVPLIILILMLKKTAWKTYPIKPVT